MVKETANLILPEGFRICWKNIVEDTPWYRHRDFKRLLPVFPDPKNRLEKAMRLFHDKTDRILQRNLAWKQEWARRSPAPETVYTHHLEKDEPTEGQFDDEDLGREVINPLETLMVTPIQDEENVTKDDQSTASGQGIGMEDAPSSQDKCRFPMFTSPSYRQEGIASQGEPDYPSSLAALSYAWEHPKGYT